MLCSACILSLGALVFQFIRDFGQLAGMNTTYIAIDLIVEKTVSDANTWH